MTLPIAATLAVALLAGPPGAPAGRRPRGRGSTAARAVELAKRRPPSIESGSRASRRSAALHPDPLLQWSNPVAGSIHGSVFV